MNYDVSFLGQPSTTEPWMIQFGGHHLGLNITLVGEHGTLAPSHTGAQPAIYVLEGKTVRPLGRETDKTLALISSLDETQRQQAILGVQMRDLVLGPGRDGQMIQPEGIKASALTETQREMLLDLASEWTGVMHEAIAKAKMVEIVRRDRSGLYAEGIRQGAPQAIQVVDRFHLVRNLRDALERLFLRCRRDLNTLEASGHRPAELTPTLATLSQARHTPWGHRYHQIRRLHAQHVGIAAIARQVRGSRPTGCRYLAMPQPPTRQRSRHRGQPLGTLHPVSVTAVECRLPQRPTALAGVGGPGASAGAPDGGAIRWPTMA